MENKLPVEDLKHIFEMLSEANRWFSKSLPTRLTNEIFIAG
jgi:hypothetical protein